MKRPKITNQIIDSEANKFFKALSDKRTLASIFRGANRRILRLSRVYYVTKKDAEYFKRQLCYLIGLIK